MLRAKITPEKTREETPNDHLTKQRKRSFGSSPGKSPIDLYVKAGRLGNERSHSVAFFSSRINPPCGMLLEEIEEELRKKSTKKDAPHCKRISGKLIKLTSPRSPEENPDSLPKKKHQSHRAGKSPKFGTRNPEEVLDEVDDISEGESGSVESEEDDSNSSSSGSCSEDESSKPSSKRDAGVTPGTLQISDDEINSPKSNEAKEEKKTAVDQTYSKSK